MSDSQEGVPFAEPGAGILELLARAFEEEVRLLGSLDGVLGRQRDSVARDDLDGVNASVGDAQRVLLTLGQARRRRDTLITAICGEAGASLHDLERNLGNTLPHELAEARDRLLEAADSVVRTLRLNDRILAGAAATGRALMKSLGAPSPGGSAGVYAPDGLPTGAPDLGAGLVLNRQV